MKGLGGKKIYSHLSLDGSKKLTNKDIRSSEPKLLNSYQELVEELARIAYYNPGFTFFYRGQNEDFLKEPQNAMVESLPGTTMYPTIFRAERESLADKELLRRYRTLDSCTEMLVSRFRKSGYSSYARMKKFPVLAWAVLQHYEVCPTPLLDVTHSARVAASFALMGNNENEMGDGYFYVLALPHSGEAMSYSVDFEVMTLRLLSICPPEAKRPFYQEGYLIGNFPHEANSKHPSYDFSNRLVAKYRLRGRNFWSAGFPAIPRESLLPEVDDVRDICLNIKWETNG